MITTETNLVNANLKNTLQGLRRKFAHAAYSKVTPKLTPRDAQALLKAKGWAQKEAAPVLGVSEISLCNIFAGRISNNRVLHEIEALPKFASSPEHSREDKQDNRQAKRGIA